MTDRNFRAILRIEVEGIVLELVLLLSEMSCAEESRSSDFGDDGLKK